MYTVMFSSKMPKDTEYRLPGLLNSFIQHTTPIEREYSEFLIKFDTEDDEEAILSILRQFDLNIKYFFWPQYGGRNSLHEVQSYLYRFKNPNSNWIQVIADDFIFTRPGFVTEILNISDNYNIIGTSNMATMELCRGLAPCFSRKFLDACCGLFGPHSNSDDFSTYIDTEFFNRFNIKLGIDIDPYYWRVDLETSEDVHNKFNLMTKSNCEIIYELIIKNIYLNMLNDKRVLL